MFGAGYAIAADRLAAMELARHNTQGRRAELLGASALEGDKMMRGRKLSDATLMQRYTALAPEHRKMIRAMVDGINKRIDEVHADPARLAPLDFIRCDRKSVAYGKSVSVRGDRGGLAMI